MIDEKLCWRCLRSGHVVKNCRSKLICEVKTCSDKYKATHHTLLHRSITSPAEVSAAGVSGTTMPLPENNGSSVSSANQEMSGSFLDILPVRVRSGNVEVLTYALLDSGSFLSFCRRKLIDVLNVYKVGIPIKASLETLTTEHPERFHTKVFDLDVLPLSGTNKFKMSKVMMIDSIPVSLYSRNVGKCVDKFPHLLDVELPVVNNTTGTLLIGNDNALLHFPVETRTASNPMEAPQTIKTPLGWILKRPNFSEDKGETSIGKSINLFLSGYRVPKQIRDLSDQIVADDVEVFPSPFDFDTTNIDELMHWLKFNRELMEFGMKYFRKDVVAYDLLGRSVYQVDGHFQLPLLWRNTATEMPESLAMAHKRLVGVKKRLERNPDLKEKYCQQMGIVLSNNYAELVPEDEIDSSKRVWYIPHHPILNPRKPEKVRVVYDCAASSHLVALNDKLMTEPDLVNKLFKVLLQFRKEKIAIVSDTEAMFYQVLVTPDDRDALRFLWWPDGNLKEDPMPHRMKVHVFGAKSSPTCASFALRQTA